MSLKILYEDDYGVLIEKFYQHHREFIKEIENKNMNILPYKCKKCLLNNKSYTFIIVNDIYEYCLSL